MEISNNTALLIICLALLILFVAGVYCKSHKDHYTRTCLRDSTNCRYVRTPVDYAMQSKDDRPTGWQSNPHFKANPKDVTQPFDLALMKNGANIDLYADERKLADPQLLFKQYGNNWAGCGNGKVSRPNDDKTRDMLREMGDESERRKLDNAVAAVHIYENAPPLRTELSDCKPDPFVMDYQLYGSPSFVPPGRFA